MAAYDVEFYDGGPFSNGFSAGTGFYTYTGPAARAGTGQITDNGSGLDGETFVDNDGVTGTFTIHGNTSVNVSTEPDTGFVLRDTVTGDIFNMVAVDVIGGPAAGTYTLSERLLIPGRTYEAIQYQDDPSATGTGYRYNEFACYAAGTMIDTPDGPRLVETLQPGDVVLTLDHGPRPVRWTRSDLCPQQDTKDIDKPVLLKAGSLGPNRPAQDLIVSPQHRILVSGKEQLQQAFSSEMFAAAKSLTRLSGVRHMKGISQITWIHFACDAHEIVFANGCLAESLLLGPLVLNGMNEGGRKAVTEIFGEIPSSDEALNGPPARDCLSVTAARRHIAKALKAGEHALTNDIGNQACAHGPDRCEVTSATAPFPRQTESVRA